MFWSVQNYKCIDYVFFIGVAFFLEVQYNMSPFRYGLILKKKPSTVQIKPSIFGGDDSGDEEVLHKNQQSNHVFDTCMRPSQIFDLRTPNTMLCPLNVMNKENHGMLSNITYSSFQDSSRKNVNTTIRKEAEKKKQMRQVRNKIIIYGTSSRGNRSILKIFGQFICSSVAVPLINSSKF